MIIEISPAIALSQLKSFAMFLTVASETPLKEKSTLYSKILFDLEDPRTVLKTICISLVALLGKQGCLKRLIDFLTDTDFSHDFTIFSQSNF